MIAFIAFLKRYQAVFMLTAFLSALTASFSAGWKWQGSSCNAARLAEQVKNTEFERDSALAELSATTKALEREKALRVEFEKISSKRDQERDAAFDVAKTFEKELQSERNKKTHFSECLDVDLPSNISDRLLNSIRRQNSYDNQG